MKTKRSRLALVVFLALALSVTGGLVSGSVAAAKKKRKKGGNIATVGKTVNAPIPDTPPGPIHYYGRLDTTLHVGKRFKGRKVSNLDVSFQTTGDSADAAVDLDVKLVAPNYRGIGLEPDNGVYADGQSIGPLTLTRNSNVGLCNSATPPCNAPFPTLDRPFAGTAGDSQLATFNGVPMMGDWRLIVEDLENTHTSVLNSVKLRITGAKSSAARH
jgi:hypothetical protein